MRRFGLILIYILAIMAATAYAGTYKLADGTQVNADPISMNEDGVVFKQPDDVALPRMSWDKFAPDGLKALYAQAKTPRERALVKPLVDNLPEETTKLKEVVVKPVETPERPTKNLGLVALFSSSVGWVIILTLYGANIFAAYEIARFRGQPVATVCGLAAVPFLGILSPIAFIAMPTKVPPPEPVEVAPAAVGDPGAPAPEAGAAPPPSRPAGAPTRAVDRTPITMSGVPSASAQEEVAPPAANLPEPVVFARGEFSFNRRFFETKFAGFFRAIRAEAEKDLVLLVKTSRGDFVGRRITRITPNELYLQTFKNDATADEMIPFNEVMEVQIRHKDAA
jgi:hypothetical protein